MIGQTVTLRDYVVDSGLLSDSMIRDLKFISPFSEGVKRSGTISYGLSSYGYDVRLGAQFARPVNGLIDPKDMAKCGWERFTAQYYIDIPPNDFVLAETVETIAMPADVLGICVGKSTYARCGLVVNTTPLEPGWCGKVTLELSNTTKLPIRVYVGEGIAQVLFFVGAEACDVTYADKSGKYQNQTGLTLPKVDE